MPNNDYILRGDAVSAICGDCKATEICGQLGEPCEEVKQIKAIPAADVEPKMKWIPVTERLPESAERYLVMRFDYVTRTPFCDLLWFENGRWWNRRYDGDYAVTHWMPLPEPPKEVIV